jgi:hypothetical protein
MATIDLSSGIGNGQHPSRSLGRLPYVVEKTIDFAVATTAKGSALAAADVIEAIDVPAQSVVLNAGYEVTATITGDVTIDVGVTGVDADVFVDGAVLAAATAVGTFAQNAAAYQPVVLGAADTVDLLISASTTAISAGKVRVWALVVDVSDKDAPGEADRDQLA